MPDFEILGIVRDMNIFLAVLKVNKELDALWRKVLFPEKLEQANKILSNTKFRYVQ